MVFFVVVVVVGVFYSLGYFTHTNILWNTDSLQGVLTDKKNLFLIELKTLWMLGHGYLALSVATVDTICVSLLIKSATGESWWADILELSKSFSLGVTLVFVALLREGQGRDTTRSGVHLLPPQNPRGMKRVLFLINHCDQSYGCTANQWSESLWKSSLVPVVPANDYVVSDAKGETEHQGIGSYSLSVLCTN